MDTRIPSFLGLMQYGDGINTDLRYATEAFNVETPGGVLQPMAACTLLPASAPAKIETLAVLHRRWYTGADVSNDVLIAAAGGVIYYMVAGETAWTALTGIVGRPNLVTNGDWLLGVSTGWEPFIAFGGEVTLSSDYPINGGQALKMELEAEETTVFTAQTITLDAALTAAAPHYFSFYYHAASLDAYATDAPVAVVMCYSADDTLLSTSSIMVDSLSAGAEWQQYAEQLAFPAGTKKVSVTFIMLVISGDPAIMYFSGAQLTNDIFTSNAWSWVQYEVAAASPELDPIDVLILSNQQDGMVYVRCDDTAKTITEVVTPKKFGVIARYNERIWGGDIAEDPDMVVYSAPYDFTDWAANLEIPEDGAGDIQQPTWDGDSFTALRQIGPQLVAFRRNTVWRILGTDPGEFTWKQQYGGGTAYENTITVEGERVLMLGDTGLLQYDGLAIAPYYQEYCRDFWVDLSTWALEQACACVYKNKYYLSVPTEDSPTNNAVVVFDIREKTWLIRTDVTVEAWLPTEKALYFTSVSAPGLMYTWGEDAWGVGEVASAPCRWVSPWIDFNQKQVRKGDCAVYLTAEGKGAGELDISVETESRMKTKTYHYPDTDGNARQKRIPFVGMGRRFRLHINSYGTDVWRLIGGIQMTAETDPD